MPAGLKAHDLVSLWHVVIWRQPLTNSSDAIGPGGGQVLRVLPMGHCGGCRQGVIKETKFKILPGCIHGALIIWQDHIDVR